MDEKTIEGMKTELEAAGYKRTCERVGGHDTDYLVSPDGKKYKISNDVIRLCYESLQDKLELQALRDYTQQLYKAGQEVGQRTIPRSDEPLFYALLLVNRSWAYIERFNITPPEGDSE